ncbi:MAG: hypothetical protein ABEJ66_03230 [Candidatus Nanohaloarchaea archaeon]
MDDDVMDVVYTLARETVPEGPQVNRGLDEGFFYGKIDILEGELGYISDLEEEGEVEVDGDDYSGSAGRRGGDLTNALQEFLTEARKGRIINYTVHNDNKENLVRIRNGGNKFITRDLSRLGFRSVHELIDSRLAPRWKSD